MSSYAEHVRRQFPFRPQHPDWDRLTEVVDRVEPLKAGSAKPEASYAGVVDVYSAAYLAANRSGMTFEQNAAGVPSHLHEKIVDLMANAWVEGLFFGVNFERLGGHRNEDGTTPAPDTNG